METAKIEPNGASLQSMFKILYAQGAHREILSVMEKGGLSASLLRGL